MGRWSDVQSHQGFTLIELVMVMILIGVISALGIGLFARKSTFSPLLATQQLESATLLAQQAALAGNEAGDLSVSRGPIDFVFTVGAGTAFEREFLIEHSGTALSMSGASFPITFNKLGHPETSGNSVQFTFAGESTYQVCLSSLGAVYRGIC